mmetsp:Transcript_23697/g.40803  ORF Transcript_23697/g.40803 Transcript_23697/m.40803 type:complete len:245 (+) Transcript_23697:796-1530(+)
MPQGHVEGDGIHVAVGVLEEVRELGEPRRERPNEVRALRQQRKVLGGCPHLALHVVESALADLEARAVVADLCGIVEDGVDAGAVQGSGNGVDGVWVVGGNEDSLGACEIGDIKGGVGVLLQRYLLRLSDRSGDLVATANMDTDLRIGARVPRHAVLRCTHLRHNLLPRPKYIPGELGLPPKHASTGEAGGDHVEVAAPGGRPDVAARAEFVEREVEGRAVGPPAVHVHHALRLRRVRQQHHLT